MKKPEELKAAREAVNKHIYGSGGLNDVQKALLCGISCALVWASGDPNSTMERMLSGELMDPGKDYSQAIRRLDTGVAKIVAKEKQCLK